MKVVFTTKIKILMRQLHEVKRLLSRQRSEKQPLIYFIGAKGVKGLVDGKERNLRKMKKQESKRTSVFVKKRNSPSDNYLRRFSQELVKIIFKIFPNFRIILQKYLQKFLNIQGAANSVNAV